ncbi:MAG: 16S rRNA processing protein RimM [Acidimicrobiaceae bacterium]|nr:16S rRNA processing protein RimM [Acidimicrobiaceae bacterium]
MLIEIARITKPHGLVGEVQTVSITNVPNRLKSGLRVVAKVKSDELELTIKSVKGTQAHPIVGFEEIKDRNEAEKLRAARILAEAESVEGELLVHELIGATVVEASGREWGTVQDVIANPASDILATDLGKYIPLVFVVGLEDNTITIEPPEGLFDL